MTVINFMDFALKKKTIVHPNSKTALVLELTQDINNFKNDIRSVVTAWRILYNLKRIEKYNSPYPNFQLMTDKIKLIMIKYINRNKTI